MIRLVVVDDHPVVRAGIVALLGQENDIDVVDEVPAAADAVEAASAGRADVVLMDLQFGPGAAMHGAEATRLLRALDPAPAVLVLTNYDSDADILGAVEAGACGYLLKDAPPAELTAAIRAAARGESALAPMIATRLLDRMRAPQVTLSSRELQVLDLVAAGRSNSDIAAELFIGETTVKSHLAHVFTKLDVGSRTAAVSQARRRGLLR